MLTRRTLTEIQELQNYSRVAFGLEDPDWSEITAAQTGISGRPGFVTTQEYLLGLTLLAASRNLDELTDPELSSMFVWMSAGRFGVRLGEAIGLYRNDLFEVGGTTSLLIQTNQVRGLKTGKSRRQVPLIEILTQAEIDLIAEVKRRWLNYHRKGVDAPLLPGVTKSSFTTCRATIGDTLRALVKAVTCNPHSTFHFLRHSFATRIFSLLRGVSLGIGEAVNSERVIHIRRLLLGRDDCDRRTLWAVARLLGHASPAATVRSYLHSLETWLPSPMPADAQLSLGQQQYASISDLDTWNQDESYLNCAPPLQKKVSKESDILRLIRFLRLYAQGHSSAAAVANALVRPELADTLSRALAIAARRNGIEKLNDPLQSIRQVPLFQWDQLVEFAKKIDTPKEDISFELDQTIGRRRQIVLFRSDHFTSFSLFLSHLSLGTDDVCLVTSPLLDATVTQWIKDSRLDTFVVPPSIFGKYFQLDSAEMGTPPQPVRHRAVAIPVLKSNTIPTTYVLLILWATWWAAQSTTIETTNGKNELHRKY